MPATTPSAGRATAAAQALRAILDAIASHRLRPEEPLRLKALADDLGVSVMPVREAVSRLAALGVLDVEPYRGARVRAASTSDLADTFRARLVIEGAACRMAAARFTEADAARAAGALERQQERLAAGDRAGAGAAARAFHDAIYDAAGSPWLVRSMAPTRTNSERYDRRTVTSREWHSHRHTEHARILAACQAHDPAAAEAALREHLLTTVESIDPLAADRLRRG